MYQSGIVVRKNKNNVLRLIKIAKFGKKNIYIIFLFTECTAVRKHKV